MLDDDRGDRIAQVFDGFRFDQFPDPLALDGWPLVDRDPDGLGGLRALLSDVDGLENVRVFL